MDREVCSLILKRWEVIDSLRNEPKDKRTLESNLDCSRSTINRAVRELESIGVVEYGDGEYEVTSLGHAVSDGFEELIATVDLRLELQPFLRWMPDDEFDLDPQYLDDADLYITNPSEVDSAYSPHLKRLESFSELEILAPFAGLQAAEIAYDRVVNHGAEIKGVVDPDVLTHLQRDSRFNQLLQKMASTGRLKVYRATTEISIPLTIIDDHVSIVAAEDSTPRALLETDREEVLQWAKDEFETHRAQAELVKLNTVPENSERGEMTD